MAEEGSDVFDEDEGGFALGDDAHEFGEERALVVVSASLACNAVGLAGNPRSDEIHAATPRSAVEGREIVPDRRAIQGLFRHPIHEAGRGEAVPLDVAHGATPGGQCEVDGSDTGAEAECS